MNYGPMNFKKNWRRVIDKMDSIETISLKNDIMKSELKI